MKTIGVVAILGTFVLAACGGSVTHSTDTGAGAGTGDMGVGGAGATTSSTIGSDVTTVTTAGPVTTTGSGGAGGGSAEFPNDGACQVIGQTQALTLTNPEYDNTIRDLLGDDSSPSVAAEFPEDGFLYDHIRLDPADPSTGPEWMHRFAHYVLAATQVATRAAQRLSDILPCDPATLGEDACASEFVRSFGKRAYRRPLSAAEIAVLDADYMDARAGGFEAGIRSVINGALISTPFLLVEPAAPAGANPSASTALDPYALASRLSYFIYRSMPDAELFDAAATGQLATQAQIATQVRRMLANEKAHPGVVSLFGDWLELDSLAGSKWNPSGGATKDPARFPTFPTLRGYMRTETTMFTESIFFGDASLSTLLTSSDTWLNQPLAELYGLPGVDGLEFRRAKLDPTTRAGLLTQASFLSLTSTSYDADPSRRGMFVDNALLCLNVPPPPPFEPPPQPSPPPGVTHRQQYQSLVGGSPACTTCHVLMDGVGYGFENFDAIGRYSNIDAGQPIDASGEIHFPNEGTKLFVGAVEMSAKLAQSNDVRDCVTKRWTELALSRPLGDDDACSLAGVQQVFRRNGNMQDLVVAIATSRAFRYARW